MARTFDLNGSGEQLPEGAGFDAPNGAIGGSDTGDSGSGDDFGGTTLSDGPADPRGGDFIFDPNVHIARDKRKLDGSFKRKRKRRGTGGNSPATPRSKADLSASIDRLTTGILIAHVTLSDLTKTPELKLSEPESKMLASSIATVMDEFGFDAVIDPKLQVVLGLITAATMIYGPRMYNIRERVKSEGKPKASLHTLRPVDNNSQMVDETRL
jgi:hypothetical protein